MANYMAFQVVIYSFWDVIPNDLLGGRISILFEIRSFETWLKGVEVCRKCLPVSCPDCYLNFTEWIHVYYTHFDRLVKFCLCWSVMSGLF